MHLDITLQIRINYVYVFVFNKEQYIQILVELHSI